MKLVPIDQIHVPPHLLRKVDTTRPSYLVLLDSMRREGWLPSAPLEVTERAEGGYAYSRDGLHRLTAATALGIAEVPIMVLDRQLSDEERLQRIVIAEASHTAARPAEYAKAVATLWALADKKGTTLEAFAKGHNMTTAFVGRALKLADLDDRTACLVDDGAIPLGNGLALAELSRELTKRGQPLPLDLVEKARHEDVPAFSADVQARLEGLRKVAAARRVPAARLRRLEDVRAELERAERDPNAPWGYVQCLNWVLRRDAVSAGAEGAHPPRLGKPDEATQLRADCVRLEDSLAAAREAARVYAEKVADLEELLHQKEIAK